MRLVSLIAAACLGLAAMAHADGKEGQKSAAPPVAPLEATGAGGEMTPISLPPIYEAGIHRFGATYAVREAATPLACASACDDAPVCAAWTFIDAYGAAPARCELKRSAGKKEDNPLAISGMATRVKQDMFGAAPALPAEAPLAPGQLKGGLADEDDAGVDLDMELATLKAAVSALATGERVY